MAAVNNLSTKVDITFSAFDVPSYDLLSPSDPVCFLFRKSGNNWVKVGRTEPLLDNANPKWSNKIRVDYHFETLEYYRVKVYDVDDPKCVDDLTKQEIIGYFDFSMGQLMSAPGGSLKRVEVFKEDSTTEKHKKMRLTLNGSEVIESRMWLTGEIRGHNLKKHGFFSQDDVSLEFVKHRPDGTTNVIYQSATVLKNNKDPRFPNIHFGLGSVFQGADDLSTPITARIVRVRRNAYNSRIVIGEVTKPVSDFLKSTTDATKTFDLLDDNKVTGQMEIVFVKVEELPTFLDYVRAGLTFRLFVHVDYTASNASARQNLHQIIPNQLNDYQRSIRACGDVLAAYSKASQITATGYGAVVSVDGGPRETNFCFPLTLSKSRPSVKDVNELLYAYDYACKSVQLSGPTNFQPGIENVVQFASQPFTADFQHFNIMLIITDGAISDMSKTIDSIVKAADKPLSIIIVGVGGKNGDDDIFDAMNVLDGDEQRLTSPVHGAAVRDIVQFLAIRDFAKEDLSGIAEATLREVPEQVISFFRLHKIKPLELVNDRVSTQSTGGYVYQAPM